MGKYTTREVRKPLKDPNRAPHAVWRGIGCLMLLIIPIVSIALGYETIQLGLEKGWPIPYQLLGRPVMPDWVYQVRVLNLLTQPIRTTPHFYAYAVTSVVYMILIGGVISMFYAFFYQMVGPARYGPFDAPPPKIKTREYKR